MSRIVKVLSVVIGSLAIDQATKVWARNTFEGQKSSSHFNDIFRWVFAENEGAFLGWGSELQGVWNIILLKLLPILLILSLLWMTLFSKDMQKNQVIPFSLILGGGLSNLFDRIVYGKVVDFMNMGIGDLRTGIFNVADMMILAGIIWYFFTIIGGSKKMAATESAEPTETFHSEE